VCVRLCDGFFYPISYSTYGARVGPDAERCQSNCAAPAELYVHPVGREIEQAISLQGSAYMDLPVALKFRKEYVKGCSCKKAEYNPAEIEAANKRAAADAAAPAAPAASRAAAPAPQATPAAAPDSEQAAAPTLELDITGSNVPAATPTEPAPPAAEEPAAPPPLPPAAEAPAPDPSGSTVAKRKTPASTAQQ
jgi:hypothetical protein